MTTPSTPPATTTPKTGTPILEARVLSRSFGHVRALDNADFDIYPGEVVALIGDNGAGKSTMVKAFTMVDLPAPLSPMSATTSPG